MSLIWGLFDLVYRLAIVMIALMLMLEFRRICRELRELKGLRLDMARLLATVKTHQQSIVGLLRLHTALKRIVDKKAESSELSRRVSNLINNLN